MTTKDKPATIHFGDSRQLFEPVWRQEAYEPGVTEMHGVDLDPYKVRLKALGKTFGQRVKHRGVKLYVAGAGNAEQADREMLRLLDLRGWKPREHWWQFWRPKFRRLTCGWPDCGCKNYLACD